MAWPKANPGNHLYIKSRKGDSHLLHNSLTSPWHVPYIPHPSTTCSTSEPPPICHPPAIGSAKFPVKTSLYKYLSFSVRQSLFIHLPMKMEQIECSETSAYKIETPGNYPKENTLYSEHGKSLKSSIGTCFKFIILNWDAVILNPG